jgi:hypothetical protein
MQTAEASDGGAAPGAGWLAAEFDFAPADR